MLKKSDIRKKANPSSYSRGMDIYWSDRVEKFRVEEDDNFDCIEAVVKGSGRKHYLVNAIYDTGEGRIEDINCECPAFSEYNGICKHGVAVLMEYIDYVERTEAVFKNALMRESALGKIQTMKGMKPKKSFQPVEMEMVTTPEMKQLLAQQVARKTLPMVQDSLYGKVRVEPLLKCDSNHIKAEFKIGVSHMYVLKDVFTFQKALENNENYLYGQKLQFIHNPEAFAPEYRPLVKFIGNWIQRNKNRYVQNTYYGYSYGRSFPKLREITLTTSDLEEFMEVMGEQEFIANVNDKGERTWCLTREELPRQMEISRKLQGIEVKINPLFGYRCDRENIYFDDGKIYRVLHSDIEPIMEFLKCMAQIPERTVYIHKEDIPLFCREMLPVLERFFVCTKQDFDEKEYGVIPVSFEIYLDAPERDFITCRVLAVYEGEKYNIYSETEDTNLRDMVSEMEMKQIVSFFCNAYDDKELLMAVAEDEEAIYEFLINGIPNLQEKGEVYISDALKRIKVTDSPKVSLGVSVAGDLLELSMTSEDMSREQLLEILSKYNKKKKFYRLKSGEFVNIESSDMEALFEIKQGLNLSEAQLKQDTIKIPKYRALYLDAELKERQYFSTVKDKEFKALVRNMKTVEDNDFDIPESLDKILREYQKRGFLWIKTLKYNGFGGILADDMGLGKTLQVICYLLSEYLEAGSMDNRRALIVCPASLVFNWSNEIEKFSPGLPVKMVIGTALERQEIIKNAGNKDILVTSYDLLKRDINCYEELVFYSQIIDEAQYIKNANTQASKTVKLINTGFKLALTGTPVENRLSELWSIFDFLLPGFLYSYKRFRDELEVPIVQNQETAAVKRLQKMITPFVLRRLKKQVLSDLPDKLEENMYAVLEGEQQKLYDAHVKKLQIMLDKQSEEEFKNSKIQILSELTKLRQICCDPSLLYEEYQGASAKTDMCMDLILNAVSGGHKILLFSQFTSMLENIQKRFQKQGIPFYSLTGATSKENRAKMVADFNQDDIPVFCISLKAGGTGLNLTAADIVIHFDPWWNLAVQDQATDRAHRIGQKNVVNVYRLLVKGTIEENITKIQEKKKELADMVLAGEGINAVSFTREELLELLR